MKSQLNKIFTLIIIFLFFSFSKSYSIDGVNELTDAINEAKEEFNNLSESSNEQSKIIDEAIKEIDKATEFVQEAIDNNNTKLSLARTWTEGFSRMEMRKSRVDII